MADVAIISRLQNRVKELESRAGSITTGTPAGHTHWAALRAQPPLMTTAGKVQPIVAGEHPLEDVEQLHDRVRAGVVIGRDVLVP